MRQIRRRVGGVVPGQTMVSLGLVELGEGNKYRRYYDQGANPVRWVGDESVPATSVGLVVERRGIAVGRDQDGVLASICAPACQHD